PTNGDLGFLQRPLVGGYAPTTRPTRDQSPVLVLLQATFALFMLGRLPQTGQPLPNGWTVVDKPARVPRARERAARAKACELAAHHRAANLHEEAAKIQERTGHGD